MAKRLVRQIGTFTGAQAGLTAGSSDGADVTVNDGKPVKTKLNWRLNTGDTLKMWAFNLSTSALADLDPQMRASGHANLWMI